MLPVLQPVPFGLFSLICLAAVCSIQNAAAQNAAIQNAANQVPSLRQRVVGVVVEQRKYSLVLQSGSNSIELAIPDRTPISQRLDRPELDLKTHLLTQELVGALPAGEDPEQPIRLKQDLPDPLGVQVEFAHENERRRLMSGPTKRFVRYRLVPWSEDRAAENTDLSFVARIMDVNEHGILTVELDGLTIQAELGNRDGQLTGRTIADLKPYQAEVEAEAEWIDNRWVAQSILFRQVIDPKLSETPGLPRVLLIGDEVSLSYLKALRKKLAGEFNIWHPPENCRGSQNWQRLDLWLGPCSQPGRQWDVVVLNCGLADLETDLLEYQAAIEQALTRLEQVGLRRLVWVSTSPLPENWEVSAGISRAAAQERIEQLNQAANQVIRRFGHVRECDLWKFVTQESQTRLTSWSRGRTAIFHANHGEVIAETIAAAIREAAPDPANQPADQPAGATPPQPHR